jgi:hypothetical protein
MSNYKYNEIMKSINRGEKPLVMFPIHRHEVESMEIKRVDDFFKTITRVGAPLRSSCGITISGYDHITDELFEIEAVQKYVDKLFRRYPYLLYYMSQEMEIDSWMLSAWADSTETVRTYDQIMTAHQAAAYHMQGKEIPTFSVKTIFEGEKFVKMLAGIKSHGDKIGDKEGANELADYYDKRFNNRRNDNRL